MTSMKKHLLLIFSLILSLFLIYKMQYYAYSYAAVVFLISCLISLVIYKNEKSRLLIIYIGSIVLAFLLAEIYFLQLSPQIKRKIVINYGGHHMYDELVGLAPVKNSQRTDPIKYKDSIIYNVTQTID